MTEQKNRMATTGQQTKARGENLGVNSEIGRKLRQFYDEIVSDAVPDRFTQLLSQLEQAETRQQKKD